MPFPPQCEVALKASHFVLQDPQKSIPKGTILAIVITTGTYLLMVLICGATVARDATGDLDMAFNGSYEFLNCSTGEFTARVYCR